MVSAIGIAQALSRVPKLILLPVVALPLILGGYAVRDTAPEYVAWYFGGPGCYSRIILLLILVINWKSMPLAWTVRVMSAFASHLVLREHHMHGPDKLFQYSICQSHVTLLDIDYNMHKTNSSYFADLDIARAHLAGHLLAPGCQILSDNAERKLVMDPRNPTKAAKGGVGVMLGAVHTSFKREIKPYQPYEIWTRVLSWDRKWFYMVSYFVEKGAVKPRSWAAASFGRTRAAENKPEDWEGKIFATAVSKYVFKMGRLTIHPAVMIGASGLLPERPGGWVAEIDSGTAAPARLGAYDGDGQPKDGAPEPNWDWRRTEAKRLEGLVYAKHFAAADELASQFDGGENGALGRWSLG